MPGLYLDNLIKMLLMLKMFLLNKKLSIIKKLTEEMVKKPILTGSLNSSKNKLLLLVKPSEEELMITSMTKDSIVCSIEEVMLMLQEVKT